MSAGRDAEYTEYVSAMLPSLRRLAMLLCQDWQRADDLVQAAITKLYVHWGRARRADHVDACAQAVLVREFVHERRSGWARRVSLTGTVTEPAAAVDHDAVLDLRTALAMLPARQRATVVLLRDGAAGAAALADAVADQVLGWTVMVHHHPELARYYHTPIARVRDKALELTTRQPVPSAEGGCRP